jgi:hypothetical protein
MDERVNWLATDHHPQAFDASTLLVYRSFISVTNIRLSCSCYASWRKKLDITCICVLTNLQSKRIDIALLTNQTVVYGQFCAFHFTYE